MRALILLDSTTANSVFSITEVNVLLRPDVLQNIEMNSSVLRNFRVMVKSELTPIPIVVF